MDDIVSNSKLEDLVDVSEWAMHQGECKADFNFTRKATNSICLFIH